jgi:site-specific DNA recombinase
LWFAAQTRLAKNKGIRGRNSKTHHADSAPRVLSGLFWCPQHDRPLLACSANGNYLGCPTCATIEPHSRPLFSKPHRRVVLRLLCQKLAALISQDDKLVERIVAACQTSAAAAQRPDAAELTSLEKSVADLTRKIEFNIRNPGDTAEDEKEIALVLQSLRQERKQFQDQLSLLKALAAEPVRVPAVDEVRSLVSRFEAILEQGARSELADDHSIVRDVLETLTGGRIDMYQQGQRKNMQGWLQARFSVRLLDLLVERATGTRLQTGVDYIDVVIDFKRPRKCDSDADAAIASWLGGAFNREIAEQIGSGESYVTRMLNLGAQRMGTTLEALRPLRKARPADPAHAPAYQKVADEVKALWWDNLIPLGTVAKRVKVSTVTANAAKDWWYESRGLKTPNFDEWSLEVERRVLELFDAEELTIGQIGEKVRRAHGTVMQIVHAACERLGRPLPDTWSRRSRLKSEKGNASESAA